MGKLGAIFAALRYGASLSDPAVWKNRQNLLNALVGLLGALVVLLPMLGLHPGMTHEDILAIAGGIAAVVGLFVNPYLTTATSDKVGLPARPLPGPQDPAGGQPSEPAPDPYRASFGGD